MANPMRPHRNLKETMGSFFEKCRCQEYRYLEILHNSPDASQISLAVQKPWKDFCDTPKA